MYSKQEASFLNQKFWTSLGQYLAPIPSAEGEKINESCQQNKLLQQEADLPR